MNRLKKLAAGAVAALTIFAATGCSNDTNWVYRLGDSEVTAGMYIGYSIQSCQNAYMQEGVDSNAPLIDQNIGEVPALDWVKAQTEESAKRHLEAEKLFNEYALSFTEDEKASIDALGDYYWTFYQQVYEPEGCGEASFKEIFLNTYKENKVFEYTYGEDGPTPVNAEEMRNTFNKEYTNIKYFSAALVDEEGNVLEGDALQQKIDEAESFVKEIKGGKAFEKVRAEAVGEEEPDDDADISVLVRLDNTSYATALMDKVKELKEGEVGYSQSEKYLYIVQRLATDDDDYKQAYIDLLGKVKGDEFTAYMNGRVRASEAAQNSAALKKYNPKDLLKK